MTEDAEAEAAAADTRGSQAPTPTVAAIVQKYLDPANRGPEWLALETYLESEGKERFDDQLDLSTAPIEVQRVIYDVVKQAEANEAALRAQLAARDDAGTDYGQKQRELARQRAQVTGFGANEKLRAWVDAITPKGPQPDPFSQEGYAWAVRKEAATLFTGFLDQWKNVADEQDAAAKVADEQAAAVVRDQTMLDFMAKRDADFKDPGVYAKIKEVYGALSETMDKPARLELAYRLAMAELAVTNEEESYQAARVSARRKLGPGSGLRAGPPARPRLVDGAAIATFYDQHPDALERDAAEAAADGGSY